MAPPRGARAKTRTPQPITAQADDDDGSSFRPIIQHRLPEMPGRMSTAYGSAVAMNPRSPMRGQNRNLQAVINRALDQAHAQNDGDDTELLDDSTMLEEDELAQPEQNQVRTSRRTPSIRATPSVHEDEPQNEPLAPRERDRLSAAPPVHKDPRLKAQPNSWVSMAPQDSRARSNTPRAASQPPESPTDFDDSTMTPRQSRAVSHTPGGRTAASAVRRNVRAGSEPASSILDMDTSRSYANESVVFGDATISTPGSVGTSKKTGWANTPLTEVPEEGPTFTTRPGRRLSGRVNGEPGLISQTAQDVPAPSVEPEEALNDDGDLYTPPSKNLGRKPRTASAATASPRTAGRAGRERLEELKTEDVGTTLDEIPPTPEPTPVPSRPTTENRRVSRGEMPQSRRVSQHQAAVTPVPRRTSRQAVPTPSDESAESGTDEPTSVKAWLVDDLGGFFKGASWTYRSVLVPLTVGVVILSILLRLMFVLGGPSSARVIKPWLPFGWGANIVILPTREADDFQDVLNRYNSEIDFLGNLKGVDGRELAQIQSWLPDLVRLERNNQGDVVIPQTFWQALLGSIREEGIIMTFNKERDGYSIDRDEHWIAIKKRMEAEKVANGGGNSNQDIGAYIADTLPRTLEDWIRNNDKKIAKMLGSTTDKGYRSPVTEKRIKDMIKDSVEKGELANMVVTKDEFMDRLRSELASARSQYQEEFKSMHPKLEKLVQEAVAAVKSTQPPAGMSRTEVTALVKNLVKSAVSAAKLEAVSSGKINADHSLQLNQRINWMNPKAGAKPDMDRTSPDYRAKKGLEPNDPVAAWVRQNYVAPPMEALRPWEGESDCWCGSHGTDRHGRPKGVQLSVLLGTAVIPTHLVVEHLPGTASVDPGARPKDIEVWAYIEEHEARERVMDFSAVHFPHNRYRDGMDDPMYEGFVKIAQFTYEDAPERNGINVFNFNEALREAPAVTDTILVRSTSNYGAPDHTCFYRVRLFGETEHEAAEGY